PSSSGTSPSLSRRRVAVRREGSSRAERLGARAGAAPECRPRHARRWRRLAARRWKALRDRQGCVRRFAKKPQPRTAPRRRRSTRDGAPPACWQIEANRPDSAAPDDALRAVLAGRLLVVLADDRKRLEHVGGVVTRQPVEVKEGGVELGTQQKASCRIPA